MIRSTINLLLVCILSTKIVHGLPRVTSASFINSFERILLEWDESVLFSKTYRNCSTILGATTLSLLGNAPKCISQSRKSLIVIPGDNARIKVGDNVWINGVNFVSVNQTLTAGGNEVVSPDILLKGPATFCPCSAAYLYYNADMSSYAGYGNSSIVSWSIEEKKTLIDITDDMSPDDGSSTKEEEEEVDIDPPDVDFPLRIVIKPSPSISTLSSLINASLSSASVSTTPSTPEIETLESSLRTQQHALQIRLNSSLLQTNLTYTVTVVARNVFGKLSSKAMTIRYMNECNPELRIVTGSPLHRYETIVFYAYVFFPACWLGNRTVKVCWVLSTYGPGLKYTKTNLLFAVPGTYEFKTYLLVVNATTQTSKPGVNMDIRKRLSFKMESQPLVAKVQGDYIESSIQNNLYISNYIFDPDFTNNVASYKWEYSDGIGNNIQVSSKRILAMDAKDLKFIVGTTYIFTFTFTKDTRTTKDSISVLFVDGVLPTLTVTSSKKSYSPEQRIIFSANIGGTVNGMVNYTWKCYDKYDANQNEILPIGIDKNGNTNVNNNGANRQTRMANLYIPGNTIEFGITVCCRCDIIYNSVLLSASDSATIDIPLQNTILDVSPLAGEVIKTRFKLRAHSWTEYVSNKPLLFRFGYMFNNNASSRYFTPWTNENKIDGIYFPIDGDDPRDMLVFVEIQNVNKALSRAYSRIMLYNSKPVGGHVMPPTKHHLTVDQFKATQYLSNIVSLSKDLVAIATKPDNLINIGLATYLDGFLSTEFTASALQNMISFLTSFVESSRGKLDKIFLPKINDLFKYLGREVWRYTKVGIDYISQIRDIISIINNVLNEETSEKYILDINVVNKLMYNYAAIACDSSLETDPVTIGASPSLISMSVFRERHILINQTTAIDLTASLVEKYSMQYCSSDQGCQAYCLTDIKYNMDSFLNNSAETGKDIFITDFYDLRFWKVGRGIKPLQIDDTNDEYLIKLDVTNDIIKIGDDVKCQVNKLAVIEEICNGTVVYGGFGEPKKVMCNCSNLGLIAAYKPWREPIIPVPEPHLNYTFHFYAPAERCKGTLFSPFKQEFRKLLSASINAKEAETGGELKMSLKRIKILSCTPGSIIVAFYIEDDVDELRNSNIKPIIDQIIMEQQLIVYLNKNIFPMFDPNQTTPKPPTPTIPPIGEVTVDWVPIGIAIAVIGCFFLTLALLSCLYNTYLLKKKIFTEINSDKPEKELTEEEELELANKKTREKTMAKIMEDVIDEEDQAVIRESKSSLWKVSYSKRIHPTTDGSTKHSATSDYYHESAMLDTYRLALDDSSDEENGVDVPTFSSTAEMFRATSAVATDVIETKDNSEDENEDNNYISESKKLEL